MELCNLPQCIWYPQSPTSTLRRTRFRGNSPPLLLRIKPNPLQHSPLLLPICPQKRGELLRRPMVWFGALGEHFLDDVRHLKDGADFFVQFFNRERRRRRRPADTPEGARFEVF